MEREKKIYQNYRFLSLTVLGDIVSNMIEKEHELPRFIVFTKDYSRTSPATPVC